MLNKSVLFKSAVLGLAVCMMVQMTLFAGVCKGIEQNVLRLHIIANSDSDFDQELKLKVRDGILGVSNGIFGDVKNERDAENEAVKRLDLFENTAHRVIQENGYDYPVDISLEDTFFETRQYENVSLPAGVYRALRVVIGKGEGKNWWCVMFPPMCLPAAQENTEPLENVLDEAQIDAVENADQYEIKFKIVEVYGYISQKIKEWFD